MVYYYLGTGALFLAGIVIGILIGRKLRTPIIIQGQPTDTGTDPNYPGG